MVSLSTAHDIWPRGISKPLVRCDHAQTIVSVISIRQGTAKETEEIVTKPLVRSFMQCHAQFYLIVLKRRALILEDAAARDYQNEQSGRPVLLREIKRGWLF